MKIKYLKNLFIALVLIFMSCNKYEKSSTTGWNYNDPKQGGFEVSDNYKEQPAPPGMVFIEGGTFTMGRTEQDVMHEWNNMPKTVTVSSFFMDATEVRNIDYLEYLHWLKRVYGSNYDNGSYPEVYWAALPDTLVWRNKLAYNEPLVEYYLRHPAYKNYPVVGVSWDQAMAYCDWRTNRVNERILIDNGYLWEDHDQVDEMIFDTDAYLWGQYEGRVRRDVPNLKSPEIHNSDRRPGRDKAAARRVQLKDGILINRLRLPTEAEWEYAALGLIGNTDGANIDERRIYPWDGSSTRNREKTNRGENMANFKRGKGDMMGIAGDLNDHSDIPAPVGTYWPNDYGLYNMAGNVSEWCLDVYRPMLESDVSDFNYFRGNVYQTWEEDVDRFKVEKDSLGNMVWRNVDDNTVWGGNKKKVDNLSQRRNYSESYNINYLDGEEPSLLQTPKNKEDGADWKKSKDNKNNKTFSTDRMYEKTITMDKGDKSSLINDETRVLKGGSWKDRAYWMAPGSRRYLNEEQATDYVGFRCVMDRVGPSTNKSKSFQRKNSDLDRTKPIKATEKTKRRNDSQIKKYRRVNKRKQGLNIPY